jgi:TonB family protein
MAAAVGYQLKSDLARVCIPAPGRAVPRRLAWTNSVCLLFLLIGVVGNQSRLPGRRAVPPLEQPVPIMIEPLPPVAPPTTEVRPAEQQNQDDKPQAPSIQAVTLDTPAINFAVPTPGSLLVPMSVEPTPAEVHLKEAAPVKHEPTTIENTGAGGERPKPDPYPPIARQLSQQGDVKLLLTVNEAGRVVLTEVKESSGFPILDGSAQDWVKRRWTVPPVNGGHLFLVTFHYHLKSSD